MFALQRTKKMAGTRPAPTKNHSANSHLAAKYISPPTAQQDSALSKFRHNFFSEQANVFQRHLLRHTTEMKRAGDRREVIRLGPSPNRIGDAFRIARKDKPLFDLRLSVALSH